MHASMLQDQLNATLTEIGEREANHRIQMNPRYARAEYLAREIAVLRGDKS